VNEPAPAKINVCLFVGPQRADGRHQLVTIFQPIALHDELTLEPSERDEVICPGVAGRNLVADAVARFRAATGYDEPVRITIE
jgi:4-diphosphocytidyl-2-C-methyl-D-erythritol kinase